ncbi:hypothetical protein C5L14_28965 [Labrys okinawensis]|uniref:Uncharacterized protein n=1 Tax=Labrys okinawensis TaxID=346911 RepID=A0A2S9Q436_9HYPH|nr:hypothetical protein [Labrys okinawensis]PRH84107.1 hypothetical protein C5L14_28965 [Labrys okinawensis]
MLSGVISLLIGIVVIGLVCWVLMYVIDRLPVDGRFKQILRILIILIAVLAILQRVVVLMEPVPTL